MYKKENINFLITIFTPTYNRVKFLPTLYDVLRKSSLKIEWIVIDDGSTDNTKKVVNRYFKKSDLLDIKYFRIENAGKQHAWNYALRRSKGKYFIGVDSDDSIILDNLKQTLKKYSFEFLRNKNIIGIRCSSIFPDFNGSTIMSNFPEGQINSWFNEFLSFNKRGERIDIFKRDLILKFPYPQILNVKFIPELWFYSEISGAGYKFIYTHIPLIIHNDQHTHLRLSKTSLYKNSLGHYTARYSLLINMPKKYWLKNPLQLIKTIVRLFQTKIYIELNYFFKKI